MTLPWTSVSQEVGGPPANVWWSHSHGTHTRCTYVRTYVLCTCFSASAACTPQYRCSCTPQNMCTHFVHVNWCTYMCPLCACVVCRVVCCRRRRWPGLPVHQDVRGGQAGLPLEEQGQVRHCLPVSPSSSPSFSLLLCPLLVSCMLLSNVVSPRREPSTPTGSVIVVHVCTQYYNTSACYCIVLYT